MTTDDFDAAPADDEAPESPPSDSVEPAAPAESERERELLTRLTQQGRETAEARRQAALAQQQAATLQDNLIQVQSQVRLLTENMSETQRRDAERQQAEMDRYLQSLPPEQRLDRKIEMLNEQVKRLQTAAAPSQPVYPQTPQQPAPPQEDPVEYMKRRAIEIVGEAQQEFGVRVDVSQLPDTDWESEDAFYRAVMRTAARSSQQNGEAPVAAKKAPANETPEQMQRRIRREVEESLGVSSPKGPTAGVRKTTKPTDDEVRAAVGTYDSTRGPKAQIAKLKEMRERLNA